MLRIEDFEYPVRLYRARDGNGYACLAFSRDGTRSGVLWPARDKRNAGAADYFGGVLLDERWWRLRAWSDRDGDLSVMVKA